MNLQGRLTGVVDLDPLPLSSRALARFVQESGRLNEWETSCIVVALDGSELAARVLPHAEALAERFGAQLILVRATPVKGVTDEALDADRREAVAANLQDMIYEQRRLALDALGVRVTVWR